VLCNHLAAGVASPNLELRNNGDLSRPFPITKGKEPRMIAYFSIAIALDPAMPTYSGGFSQFLGTKSQTAITVENAT
jgi:hypothetical protein